MELLKLKAGGQGNLGVSASDLIGGYQLIKNPPKRVLVTDIKLKDHRVFL
jgi:hypothetical protein